MPRILDQYGKPVTARRRSGRSRVSGSYDAAATTDENKRHWANADSLSSRAAADPATRQRLRDRARYEAENNSYLSGLNDTLANDLVGTGPRLQLSIPGINRVVTRQIENMYGQWADQIDLPEDLRVASRTKVLGGEAFGLEVTNPALDRFLPQLDLRWYEAEQVSTPGFFKKWDPRRTDGIVFDDFGNPVEYHFLKYHPGGDWGWLNMWNYDAYPASRVHHWFRPTRPGQARGVTEIAPALPLFALGRRFGLATVTAAEFAASVSGVLEADDRVPIEANDEDEDGSPAEAWQRIEIERNALFTAPAGWKVKGFDATQPTSTYGAFSDKLLNEEGRCLNAPFNVIAGNSSGYNYSSGRLDHVIYHRSIRVERSRMVSRILNRLFRNWLREAFLLGIMPDGLPPIAQWKWSWYWDGFESIDPLLDAQANALALQTNTTTLAEIYAECGQDWEEQLRQRAREIALCNELGLAPYQALPTQTTPRAPGANSQQEVANVA